MPEKRDTAPIPTFEELIAAHKRAGAAAEFIAWELAKMDRLNLDAAETTAGVPWAQRTANKGLAVTLVSTAAALAVLSALSASQISENPQRETSPVHYMK